jgi:ankyrin repeat protein
MTVSKKNAPRAVRKANARIAKGSLFDAVERLDLAEVERLLAAGVSPNERWPEKYRGTALHTACCGNCEASLAIVKALLAAGADIDAIERHNRETPLHFAVDADGSDDWRIVRHLLRSKAKVNLCNRDGLIPAELASCLEHSSSAVIAMLDEGMPVETRGAAGTLLWYCSYDSYSLVVELANRGADIEAREWLFGETPLLRACEALEDMDAVDEQADAWKIFCFLLDRGADRECVDNFGNRPSNFDMLVGMYDAQKQKAEMFADIADPLRKSSRPDFYSPPKK